MQLPFLPPVLTDKKPPPQWDPFTPAFSRLSKMACTHPIHTISVIALLASTTYLSILEHSLFDRTVSYDLLEGSGRVAVGEQTGWEWVDDAVDEVQWPRSVALVTLSFPTSSAPVLPYTPMQELASDDESTKLYAIPYEDLTGFVNRIKELAVGENGERKQWVMRTKNGRSSSRSGIFSSLKDGVLNVWEMVKVADPIDVVIMLLGYIAMHLTFVWLFLGMRRLGSNFWLGTTVLLSSTFSFLFATFVTHRLGVPINMILLSEGLPFLVVTIGFEKPMKLTRAVLDASMNLRKQSPNASSSIQSAIVAAVREKGFEIVRDYVIEITILTAGVLSGVQGGLRQFCFLAAWILAFDCILLFTFYTAILSIKLEINRIKRHITLRKALEEDGVSRRVAEDVANANEWPHQASPENSNGQGKSEEGTMVFGKKVKDATVSRFKVLMVTGFVLVNLFNLLTLPYREHSSSTVIALGEDFGSPKIDVKSVAGDALRQLAVAREPMVVTVLPPIEYELQQISPRPSGIPSAYSGRSYDVPDWPGDVVGSKVVESLLKSFEDPLLGKWMVAFLFMSLVLNGYLFNAARWSVKDPQIDGDLKKEIKESLPQVVERIVTVSCTCGGAGQRQAQGIGEANSSEDSQPTRTIAECEAILKEKRAKELNNGELVELSLRGKIPGYALEKTLGDSTRAVLIRRSVISRTAATAVRSGSLEKSLLPYEHYDYDRVLGSCCENVIGYLPLPVGVAGPMTIDGVDYFIPMATTEGVLVASTSRGAKACNAGGGIMTALMGDGMTRGPVVSFPNVSRAAGAKVWIDSEEGQKRMKKAFDSTSRFARLQTVKCTLAGSNVYIRFKTTTGDAMGMNMISKGCECVLATMQNECGFEDMEIISLSGNYCTDKKPAAINWIEGRGKSVVAEALIPANVVKSVLKSSVDALVELGISKNFIGSAMAGSIGGFNAHAANIVTAIFLATGQDPAQNVESSNCITIMKKTAEGDLSISVTMPSIEVGTVGGGTILEPQGAMLDMLCVRGPNAENPGTNARQLARLVAAATLAGELSLCSALAAGHLVQSHMAHNRSQPPTRTSTPAPTIAPLTPVTPSSAAASLTTMKDQQRGIAR